MIVCHPSLSGISDQFIGTTGTTGGSDSKGDESDDSTFLFRTFGIDIQITFGDLDLLRRL